MMNRAIYLSILVCLYLLQSIASAAAEAPNAILIQDALAIARVSAGGRNAVPTDAVWNQIASDQFTWPKEGDTLALPRNRTAKWEPVHANKDGWFEGPALMGGYVACSVDLPDASTILLQAEGDTTAFVNGEPRAGDPYAYDYLRLPVVLHRGTNHLLFACGRGRLRVRLIPAHAPLMIDVADATTPDVLTTDRGELLAGVVVINAMDHPARGLRIAARAQDGAEPTISDLPEIPAMSLRKVTVRFRVPEPVHGKTMKLTLALSGRNGSTKDHPAVDTADLELRVRETREVHKRTFISAIDGSVQYYAINPAQKPSPSNLLILTLHGAAVEALGQASAYASKEDATLVAPTNRRPYGFDWEDIGQLDAIEVLNIAERTIPHDPHRVILTGHSMGGHGTWQVGLTFPGRFAAIGPSAGWSSFTSYGGGRAFRDPTPVERMLQRAGSPSNTLGLVRNSISEDVYILHGDADDNVPVREARMMRDALAKFHPHLQYHEEPGAGHWWGSKCVDWPPMFKMFDAARLPSDADVNSIDFTTADPAISGRCHWATIEQQVQAMELSTIKLDRQGSRITGATKNVEELSFDLTAMGARPKEIELDGQAVSVPAGRSEESLVLRRHEDKWSLIPVIDPAQKNSHRGGPFKQAYANHLMAVYATHGSAQENDAALADARHFAEDLYYRGNGAIDLVPDTQFDADATKDRNVLLFGNADTNAAWSHLLDKDCPIDIRNGHASISNHRVDGNDLAALFIYPRVGSATALVGVVASTGPAGTRLAERLPLLVSGVAYPDWIVIHASALSSGEDGIAAAGFFANDWSMDPKQSAWNEKQ